MTSAVAAGIFTSLDLRDQDTSLTGLAVGAAFGGSSSVAVYLIDRCGPSMQLGLFSA